MTNILITGCDGFIGRNVNNFLLNTTDRKLYRILYTNRYNLDLLDKDEVKRYLNRYDISVIIHCANVGGKRTDSNSSYIYKDNITMFDNILSNIGKNTKLINFGSGAEFISDSNYGKSKVYMKENGMLNLKDRYYHVRLYGCFGKDELDIRFIKSCLNRYYNEKMITIHQNKQMDFVYIKDVMNFVNDIILSRIDSGQYNLVYKEKYTLYDIAMIVNHLREHKVTIEVENKTMGDPYIGEYKEWDFKYGLHNGIKEMADIR